MSKNVTSVGKVRIFSTNYQCTELLAYFLKQFCDPLGIVIKDNITSNKVVNNEITVDFFANTDDRLIHSVTKIPTVIDNYVKSLEISSREVNDLLVKNHWLMDFKCRESSFDMCYIETNTTRLIKRQQEAVLSGSAEWTERKNYDFTLSNLMSVCGYTYPEIWFLLNDYIDGKVPINYDKILNFMGDFETVIENFTGQPSVERFIQLSKGSTEKHVALLINTAKYYLANCVKEEEILDEEI